MTCSPMVRDFFDETGVPILYMDLSMQMMHHARDLFKSMDSFHAITVGAYQIMGRLSDVPFTTEFSIRKSRPARPLTIYCAGLSERFRRILLCKPEGPHEYAADS